jgi:hypothetical protein
MSKRERQARWRARRRLGRRVVTVDLDELDVIEALIASGRLDEAAALNPQAVADAIGEVVSEWSRHWTDAPPLSRRWPRHDYSEPPGATSPGAVALSGVDRINGEP